MLKDIREKVLKYLMVRRTRTEITKYFAEDLASQKLRFPDIEKPEAAFYELNDKEDIVFTKTIELIAKNSNTLVIPRCSITRAK